MLPEIGYRAEWLQCTQHTDPQSPLLTSRKKKKTMANNTISHPAVTLSDSKIFKGATISGISNGVINGAIQWFLLRANTSLPLSVDGITNDQQTVLGTAVPLAVSLAMILTVIAYLTLKAPKRSFLPSGLWLTIKHGIFVFGLIVAGAVVWQRTMGSVTVSLTTAVVVLAVVSGVVGAVVNYMTIRASLLR